MHKSDHSDPVLHLYQFLLQCSNNLGAFEFNDLLRCLQNPRSSNLQHNMILQSSPQLREELEKIRETAATSGDYEDLVIRVADSYQVINHVRVVLVDDRQFKDFVKCLQLNDPSASHEQVSEAMATFQVSLDLHTRSQLEVVLNSFNEPSTASSSYPSLDTYLKQARQIINDETLFQQFQSIMYSAIPINEAIVSTYGLIKSTKPEIWESLSPILDQMQSAQETEQYSSYEEYVKRTFLDGGGQDYLDAEIDGAQMDHMMSQMSMQK